MLQSIDILYKMKAQIFLNQRDAMMFYLDSAWGDDILVEDWWEPKEQAEEKLPSQMNETTGGKKFEKQIERHFCVETLGEWVALAIESRISYVYSWDDGVEDQEINWACNTREGAGLEGR